MKLWQEIKRRNVLRTLAIYSGSAFAVLEAVDMIFPRWGLPDWTIDVVLYLLILGAVVAVIISWTYDLTPEGIVKTSEAHDPEKDEMVSGPGKRKWVGNIIIIGLVIVVGILLYPKLFRNDHSPFTGRSGNTIAVLPLKIIGNDSEANMLAAGLGESISYMLSKIGNTGQLFSVIPTSEIMENITSAQARQRYGASLVISGSIQVGKQQTRLILNLVDTKKQKLLRSEKLDYQKEENLILQDEAVSLMVSMLGLRLTADTKKNVTAGGSTSPEANELYLRGKGILRNHQNFDELEIAIDLFHQALQIDPSFALAYAELSQTFWKKYRDTKNVSSADSALFYIKRAVELNENNPAVHIGLGMIYSGRGEYENAVDAYREAIKIDPEDVESVLRLGRLYVDMGAFDKAEFYFRNAMKMRPDYWRCYSSLGAFYYFNGEYDSAIVQYNLGLQLAPANQNLLMGLAGMFWLKEDFTRAIDIYEKILLINPENANVITNMGTANYYLGNFKEAVRYYKQDLQLRPDQYRIHGYLADALLWSGNNDASSEEFTIAINMAKRNLDYDPDAIIYLADYYSSLGLADSSLLYLERAKIPDDPDYVEASLAFIVGEIYLSNGEKIKGLEWIESGLKRDYGWIEIKYSPIFKTRQNDLAMQKIISKYSKNTASPTQ
jgi:tetratricopeptide (TPR) repeat protein